MKIAIFGNGGHAGEIADICDNAGFSQILFVLPDYSPVKPVQRKSVVFESDTSSLFDDGFMFAIGVSDGSLREKIYRRYPNLMYPNLIHKSVSLGRGIKETLENRKGVIIAAGARFMNSVDIGNFSSYGLNCTIGHDTIISPFVSIMPGANISGYVCLKKYVCVGAGATIIQGTLNCPLIINESAIVGAGAVVTKSFYHASKIVGIPARNIDET